MELHDPRKHDSGDTRGNEQDCPADCGQSSIQSSIAGTQEMFCKNSIKAAEGNYTHGYNHSKDGISPQRPQRACRGSRSLQNFPKRHKANETCQQCTHHDTQYSPIDTEAYKHEANSEY